MRVLQFLAGLVLAPLFAISLMTAVVGTVVLVKDAVTADDWGDFESRYRHYTDRMEITDDGQLLMHRSEHPIAAFVAIVLVSWIAALGFGWLLELLRRSLVRQRNGAGIAPAPGS